jgi:hypothetical protein
MTLHSTFTIALLVLIVFCKLNSSFAQENNSDKTRFTDIQMQFGLQRLPIADVELSDFRKLMPNSTVLDTFSIAKYSLGSYNAATSSYFNLLASLRLKNWKKGELRFGVSSFSHLMLSSNYFKSNSFRSDTLTSSATGQQIFIDSTETYGLNLLQQADFIRLEVAAIFRTSEGNRFQFFTGFGIATAIGYRVTSSLTYSRTSSLDAQGQDFDYYSSQPTNQVTEVFTQKSNFIHTLYIPLGAELKLHKLQDPKHKFSLYGEFRPSLAYHVVPTLKPTLNAALQSSLGVRYRF